jgi:hypothetical protein
MEGKIADSTKVKAQKQLERMKGGVNNHVEDEKDGWEGGGCRKTGRTRGKHKYQGQGEYETNEEGANK